MNTQELLLFVMTLFVCVSAVALLIQMGLLFAMFKVAKNMQEQTNSVLPQVKSILAKADDTLEQSRKHIVDITSKANDMMDMGKAQLVKLDAVVTDASTRAKAQFERAEMVVDDTLGRVHETVTTVHHGVLKPIREIQGVAAGVKMAVGVFLKGGRPSVAQATQDDEMFI